MALISLSQTYSSVSVCAHVLCMFFLQVNSTSFTHSCVLTGLGEYHCICGKKQCDMVCGSRGSCMQSDNPLQWCHSVAKTGDTVHAFEPHFCIDNPLWSEYSCSHTCLYISPVNGGYHLMAHCRTADYILTDSWCCHTPRLSLHCSHLSYYIEWAALIAKEVHDGCSKWMQASHNAYLNASKSNFIFGLRHIVQHCWTYHGQFFQTIQINTAEPETSTFLSYVFSFLLMPTLPTMHLSHCET